MRLKLYLDFIKIEHTLFALPIAYAGAVLAGEITLKVVLLILTAFTGLRTFAMACNRIIDREIDAKNPRTAKRHLPAGLISLREAYAIALFGLALYFVSAFFINITVFILSPIPAVVSYFYPYLKRFTCLSHYFLGLSVAFALLGGWIAVKDSIMIPENVLLFALALLFWEAGFDMIYALQDAEFDRKERLHSIGGHFGVKFAKRLSILNHVIFFSLLLLAFAKEPIIRFSLPLVAFLLILEHYIIREKHDEERIQMSFFYLNALLSASLFLSIFMQFLLNLM
ncbi:MAG: putative 4-hydroxybenzoate polyprenyltransferase [Archaeoglobaceae archaeon]|nr:putative 4-hydroxybenzoate polyprenyltransferase [Archaeoglobaceae archaeon]MDW8128645.1 UbiA-like polyprenyltransferase [Archaeoglobaceae archaeon]